MYSDEFSKLPINGNETTGDYGKMEVTDRMKENLSTAAKWMKFLSITGAGATAFFMFCGLVFLVLSFVNPENVLTALLLLFSFGLYIPLIINGFKFVSQSQKVCQQNDGQALEGIFDTIRFCAMYLGILCIVSISFYILWTIVATVFSVSF